MRYLLPLALAGALLGTTPSAADYLSPEQAGFADCMLIYETPERPAESLMPYVATAGADGQWLFDSFLFLRFGGGPSGAMYYNGPTNMADWEYALDQWFAPGRDLAALQEAVAQASAALGPPPSPRTVVLSLHYPSTGMHDFGDVDGDERSEDLANPDDCRKAIAWHVDEAIRRFSEADLPDLRLWGFYWMNEDIAGEDQGLARMAAEIVHGRGYRMLWIPYYRAAGFRQWRELGFDAGILQPNYAFLEQHDGRIRNDRILETAALARDAGMGVEIEAGSVATDPRAREMFLDYLAFGADGVAGYQRGAKAYYQGTDLFRQLRDSPDPDARSAYGQIARFLGGRPVPRPGALTDLVLDASPLTDGRSYSPLDPQAPTVQLAAEGAVLRFREPRRVEEVEVSLVRGSERRVGRAVVEATTTASEDWVPAGWTSVSLSPRTADTAWTQVAALPVGLSEVTALRVRMLTPDGGVPPIADEISLVSRISPGQESRSEGHLAAGCRYTVEPAFAQAYPDAGGMLTDGVVGEHGWSEGKSVGWFGTGATIVLDLGPDRAVDEVVVRCDGGGSAGVEIPDSVTAELYAGAEAPSLRGSGTGAPPPEPAAVACAGSPDVTVDWQDEGPEGRRNATGAIRLRLPAGAVTARWVMLRLTCRGWLMVSEVEASSGGANVARGVSYTATPLPTPRQGLRYADDGLILTDGVVAEGFVPPRLVGWTGQQATVTLDLGASREIREVRVHTLGGGSAGIFAPRAAEVDVSADGTDWRAAGRATLADPGGDVCVALTLMARFETEGRYVRVRVEPSTGWLMLSEIEVH